MELESLCGVTVQVLRPHEPCSMFTAKYVQNLGIETEIHMFLEECFIVFLHVIAQVQTGEAASCGGGL
jgi:hypothetical protein